MRKAKVLSKITPLIQKITEEKDLTTDEAERAFMILERKDEESYFLFTFLAALHTKGETSDELLGLCKANARFVPAFDVGIDADKVIDLSGTGGDRIKTPNISTAATFVVAGKGIAVAKQAFFGLTGLTGSADLMRVFGVDPLAISQEGPDRVRNIFQQMGMVVYHANSMADPEERKGYFNYWLKNVPETGLTYVTAYHLAANAYSPIPMKRRVYGVFGEKYLQPLAELFQKLGFRKGLVFHGVDGLDEVSNVGPTRIIEFSGDSIKDYMIIPNDLGVKTAQPNEIKAVSREANIYDFLKIIYGKEKGAKRDLVLINAAPAFYAMDEVPTLKDGVELAASIIDEGKASAKLEEFISFVGDPEKLAHWKKRAEI